MEKKPVLSVRGLTIEIATSNGLKTAVSGVSLDVNAGEVLGLVGESGAGKSLVGSAICGIMRPPARIGGGAIYLDGRRIDNLPEREMRLLRGRHIGLIFQDPLASLNPLLTIGQQLVETIRTHGGVSHPDARARAIALLDEVGIPSPSKRIDHYPHQFSGGMRQRVVIALALCAEPRLIIADEPTTALDVSLQAQIILLLRHIVRDRGMSVVLITHDIGVVAEIADRAAVLYAGQIVETGPVDDVLNAPQHPYTRGLLHCVPMIGVDVEELTQIPGAMPSPGATPPGCAFHPRCGQKMVRCESERPPIHREGTFEVACWNPRLLSDRPAEIVA